MAVPLILFTVLFIVGPMVYMVALSFMTRADTWGVVPEFTLKNYGDIGQPVYLRTFGESLKLAVISTVLIIALGYPFGYFMAKLGPKWKKRTMLLLMIPFWTSSLIRLYGWDHHLPGRGRAGLRADGPAHHQRAPEGAVHLPGGGGGHGVRAAALYDFRGVLQRGEAGLLLGGGRPGPGGLAHEGLPHRVPQADAAGAALWGGAHLCAQHGAVLHRGFAGRQQGGAGGQPSSRPS